MACVKHKQLSNELPRLSCLHPTRLLYWMGKGRPKDDSSTSEGTSDEASTSSDEDVAVGKATGSKRQRKYYKPEGQLKVVELFLRDQ